MIRVEWFKYRRSLLLPAILILAIAIVIGGRLLYPHDRSDYYARQQKQIESEKHMIETIEQLNYLDDVTLDQLQLQAIDQYNEATYTFYMASDTAELISAMLDVDKARLSLAAADLNAGQATPEELKDEITLLTILQEKNIAPLIIANDHSITGLFYNLHNYSINLLLLILIGLNSVNIFLENPEDDTLRWYYRLPISRNKILQSKFWLAIFTALFIYLLFIITIALIGGHLGPFDYPLLFATDHQCIAVLGQVVSQLLVTDLLLIIITVVLTALVSTLTFDHEITLIISLLIGLTLGYYINYQSLTTLIIGEPLIYIMPGIALCASFIIFRLNCHHEFK